MSSILRSLSLPRRTRLEVKAKHSVKNATKSYVIMEESLLHPRPQAASYLIVNGDMEAASDLCHCRKTDAYA